MCDTNVIQTKDKGLSHWISNSMGQSPYSSVAFWCKHIISSVTGRVTLTGWAPGQTDLTQEPNSPTVTGLSGTGRMTHKTKSMPLTLWLWIMLAVLWRQCGPPEDYSINNLILGTQLPWWSNIHACTATNLISIIHADFTAQMISSTISTDWCYGRHFKVDTMVLVPKHFGSSAKRMILRTRTMQTIKPSNFHHCQETCQEWCSNRTNDNTWQKKISGSQGKPDFWHNRFDNHLGKKILGLIII